MMLNSRLQSSSVNQRDSLNLKILDIQKGADGKQIQASPLVTYHKRDLHKRDSSTGAALNNSLPQNQQQQQQHTSGGLFNILSQQKPQFMFKNISTHNQGANNGSSLLQHQQTYKTARSSMERIYGGAHSGVMPKKDSGPVYLENKQFFYDLAYVPVQKQVAPVDKETINESVQQQQQSGLNRNHMPALSSQQPFLNQSQILDVKSHQNRRDTSIGELEDTSQMSFQMPLIDLNKKKKKNLNEVASLYISSEEDDDDDQDALSQYDGARSTIGHKTMMSNYSNRLENMKLSLLSRFRQSKGLLSPQHNTGMNKKGSIEHREYVVENDYSSYRQGGAVAVDSFTQFQQDLKYQVREKKKLNFSQRISEQAVFDYYRNYKNLKASIERDEHLVFPQSAYISSCEKSNLIPRPYGLVTYKGEDEELNVKNFLMGNKYAKAYGQGLQLLETKKVNVSNNRLDERGTMSVLKGLNKKAVEDVDLSNNKIGIDGVQYISDLLMKGSEGINLRILKLEQTQLSDSSAIVLIQALDMASDINKSYLQELNLACNNITCVGAEKIAQYLGKNPVSLKVLNLHWNKIKYKSGLKLAEALQNNGNLKVLDLSWNALGKTSVTFAGQLSIGEVKKKLKGQGQFANQEEAIQQISDLERQELESLIGRAWGKALGYNKYLVHLDLSYNSFGIDSCRIMQKKIKKNHTLYGLHLAGNACQVDTHGFIVLPGDDQFSQDRPQTTAGGSTQLQQDTSTKKSTQLKPTSKSQSRASKQKSSYKSSQQDIHMKSPQKEVLFKRMEGMKAIIKKRNASFGVQSPHNIMNKCNNAQPLDSSTRKTNNLGDNYSSINYQSLSNISQPGASLQKYKMKDNCWICEGWSEFKFDLRVPQYIGAEVYLHFDFDEYRPDLMVSISAGVYSTWRMIPPGTHYYFMSVNGSEYFTSGSNIVQIEDSQVKHIDSKLQKTFSDKYIKTFNLKKLNFVESIFQHDTSTAITPRDLQQTQQNTNRLSSSNRSTASPYRTAQHRSSSKMSNHNHTLGITSNNNTTPGISPSLLVENYSIARIRNCVPRPDKKFLTTKAERPRTPWTFPISLFKEYKPEIPALVNDCFEFDWQCLRKPKMKKSTEEELKEKCREIYPFIREIYKRLAALGIVGTVFSIGWNVYREFMIQTLNVTDKDKLKPDDCDRLFIGVNAGNQRKAPFIPEKALVRFQFLEILMKAGIKRYFESGDVESELDAMDQLIVQNISPIKEISDISSPYSYNQQRWRQERYWNEACDNIMKAFAPLFTYIYNTFGGSHKKPGQKTFMTLDEFDVLIQTAGLVNDMMNQRDIALHFNFAMMCQVNEIDYERHLQATYIEFLEAFARVCDQASIVIYSQSNKPGASLDPTSPKGDQLLQQQQQQLQQQLDQQQIQDYLMTEEERQSLPLHVKIENAIQYLLKNCCSSKGFLDKFDMPKKHPQVGLYILPNKKFF